jgi:4-hydroxy-tetrahydrodipicolinate synthase
VAPIATAITPGGEMDFEGTLRIADWLIANGVDGIFVAGTTGRFSDFPPEQNARLCQTLAEGLPGIPLYGGICDSGVARMLANAQRMKDAGAMAVVATGPYYLSRLPGEREEEILRLAAHTPLPVLFYDIPEFVGYRFRAEWIAAMADHENVVGYKDSSGDIAHHREVLQRTQAKEFSVLIGKELLLAEALRCGAGGLVVSFLHADPKPFVALAGEAARGNWEGAEFHQEQVREIVSDFLTCYERRPVFSTLLQYLEGKLNDRGLGVRLV